LLAPRIDRRAFVVGVGATTITCAAFAQGTSPMPHIVLLGDSVFDNAAYVPGGPEVVQQLRAILPPGWRATLSARDGASIADLPDQLQKLPAGSSHLVVSIGGNDALGEAALLDAGVTSMAEALERTCRLRSQRSMSRASRSQPDGEWPLQLSLRSMTSLHAKRLPDTLT